MSSRRSLVLVGAVVGSAVLGGCSYSSPQTTEMKYAASDGIVADLENVGLRNIMLISGAKNAPGQLYGSVVNSGSTASQVTFTSDMGNFPTITVPAGQVVNLTTKAMKIPRVPVLPGENVSITVGADGNSQQLTVPVLDGTLPEYKTLVPSASATSKAATPKPSTSK